MPIKVATVYYTNCDWDFLKNNTSKFNFDIITINGTTLRTRITNHSMYKENIVLEFLFEKEEGPFMLDGEQHYVSIELFTKIALIYTGYVIIFNNYRNSEEVVLRLNREIKELKLKKINFNNDFLKLLSNNKIVTEATFSQINLPGISKARIQGSNIHELELYINYMNAGKLSFIRFIDIIEQIKVGVSEKGLLMFYTKITEEKMLDYILNKVLLRLP